MRLGPAKGGIGAQTASASQVSAALPLHLLQVRVPKTPYLAARTRVRQTDGRTQRDAVVGAAQGARPILWLERQAPSAYNGDRGVLLHGIYALPTARAAVRGSALQPLPNRTDYQMPSPRDLPI